ncbi:hypothetical protein ACJX0J_025587, partial [Zea mays]
SHLCIPEGMHVNVYHICFITIGHLFSSHLCIAEGMHVNADTHITYCFDTFLILGLSISLRMASKDTVLTYIDYSSAYRNLGPWLLAHTHLHYRLQCLHIKI